MKKSMLAVFITLVLCIGLSASNGQGSGQDNSPGNGIDNSGTPNNPNHPNNGNHGTHGGGSGGSSTENIGQGGVGGAGGSATATGGDSSASSTSSAVSVASSSSTSSAKQSQNQGQVQGQQQSQSANNDGNKQSTTINQNQVRQAPMAYAPDAFPSAPCRVSGSAGVSAPIGGISLGGSKLDKDCSRRETARSFLLLGLPEAACKVLLSTRDAKEAGLTQADCVVPVQATSVVPEVAPAPVVVPEAPAPPAIVVIPVTVTLQPPVTLPVLAQSPRKSAPKKAPSVTPCKYTINVCVQ